MHWTGLILATGLTLLCLYIRLFVGSARGDAEHQMNILTILIVAFAASVAVIAWAVLHTRQQDFEWRGTDLSWRDRNGDRVTCSINDVSSVHKTILGWIVLTFADGVRVQFSESARGAGALLASIAEERKDLKTPPAPPAI